jgi:hypothetical protein
MIRGEQKWLRILSNEGLQFRVTENYGLLYFLRVGKWKDRVIYTEVMFRISRPMVFNLGVFNPRGVIQCISGGNELVPL